MVREKVEAVSRSVHLRLAISVRSLSKEWPLSVVPEDISSTTRQISNQPLFSCFYLSLSLRVSLYSWTCHNVRIVNQPVPHHMLVRSLKLLTRVNTVFLSHFFSLFTPFSYHTTLIFRGYGEFYSPERTTSALYSLHYSWSLSHHWRSFLSRLAGNTFIIKFY